MHHNYNLEPMKIARYNSLMIHSGKWWEAEHDADSLLIYIKQLEDSDERHDQNYRVQKIAAVCDFLREGKEILSFDEFVFLCLRLAGYTYPTMEKITKSLSKSDSTMQRKVQRALSKIEDNFRLHGKDKDKAE